MAGQEECCTNIGTSTSTDDLESSKNGNALDRVQLESLMEQWQVLQQCFSESSLQMGVLKKKVQDLTRSVDEERAVAVGLERCLRDFRQTTQERFEELDRTISELLAGEQRAREKQYDSLQEMIKEEVRARMICAFHERAAREQSHSHLLRMLEDEKADREDNERQVKEQLAKQRASREQSCSRLLEPSSATSSSMWPSAAPMGGGSATRSSCGWESAPLGTPAFGDGAGGPTPVDSKSTVDEAPARITSASSAANAGEVTLEAMGATGSTTGWPFPAIPPIRKLPSSGVSSTEGPATSPPVGTWVTPPGSTVSATVTPIVGPPPQHPLQPPQLPQVSSSSLASSGFTRAALSTAAAAGLSNGTPQPRTRQAHQIPTTAVPSRLVSGPMTSPRGFSPRAAPSPRPQRSGLASPRQVSPVRELRSTGQQRTQQHTASAATLHSHWSSEVPEREQTHDGVFPTLLEAAQLRSPVASSPGRRPRSARGAGLAA
mmetsp:Transcript_53195/g.105636  ORF Transcript_53195/g.105636 Transcript_53195/m.105636 type:complete len:490 (-) Transcript_53195:70-1539(-)